MLDRICPAFVLYIGKFPVFGGAPTKMLILWEIYNKAVDAGLCPASCLWGVDRRFFWGQAEVAGCMNGTLKERREEDRILG